jgi:N6-L-threonylcarbamoyladenine synthase
MAKVRDYLLGIDTSCDETSFALLQVSTGRVLVNLISSQIKFHAEHGGVVPELASRKHSENLATLFQETLSRGQITTDDLCGIAVTNLPGLIGCLLVGTSFAKALAHRLQIPLYAVNHLEAHLFSPFIGEMPVFPFLGLVVSGGHTAFYRVRSFADIALVGQTVDDAAGEAYDKAAKLMGLGYPGGPLIDKLAQQGNAKAYAYTIPKVKMGEEYLSFSGLKTALHHHVKDAGPLNDEKIRDLSASLQNAIVEALVRKAEFFLAKESYQAFAVSGGVAMNSLLRKRVSALADKFGIPVRVAGPEFCTDNGAMIAYVGLNKKNLVDPFELSTMPSRKIQARELAKGKRT